MHFTDIATRRLYSQRIAQADIASAHDIVAWMGAMQAQDYAGALWAVALRSPALTAADVEQAITNRTIVRTWPMRGTLHFVAAEDARWMTQLLTPRIVAGAASRRKQLGIDEATLTKSRRIIENALSGGHCFTRQKLLAVLEVAGIATAGQRGIHILHYFAELGLLCFGPHEGKQPTFVLLEEWLPKARELSRDEALATLATRYFISHGPATLKDFAGWGHLPMTDARAAISMADSAIASSSIGGLDYWHSSNLLATAATQTAFLLPGFDEFMLGYKDRTPALMAEHAAKIVPGNNGMFLATIVVNGQVAGTWKKTLRKNTVTITLLPFYPLTDQALEQLEHAAKRYGKFLGLEAEIVTL